MGMPGSEVTIISVKFRSEKCWFVPGLIILVAGPKIEHVVGVTRGSW